MALKLSDLLVVPFATAKVKVKVVEKPIAIKISTNLTYSRLHGRKMCKSDLRDVVPLPPRREAFPG